MQRAAVSPAEVGAASASPRDRLNSTPITAQGFTQYGQGVDQVGITEITLVVERIDGGFGSHDRIGKPVVA
jgi:hypothetical protein